ncbi:hypothetical protein [Chitinophaga flava]|uniref:Pyrrolo-quinoline quinone n=1 Tax=Chitinophaga flava TaxID=2259036 RepID=A0A365XVP9_9BACT|nr:hypothetical protein [Chitinophaga flava]RBL90429.1 hypothetical protein DF182_28630 [Chitinophaga flava]
MFILKEQLKGYTVKNDSRDELYYRHHKSVFSLNKEGLDVRKLQDNVSNYSKIFRYQDAYLFNCNGELLMVAVDGTETRLGKELYPAMIQETNIIVTSQAGPEDTLARIDAAGNVRWEVPVSLGNQHLQYKDMLYYIRIDDVYKVRTSIINKMSLDNGEYNVLIDFNDYYRGDLVGVNAPPDTFYELITVDDAAIVAMVNNRRIVSVDVNTGEIRWETDQLTDMNGGVLEYFVSAPIPGGMYNGKRYILQGSVFACLDIQQKKLVQRRFKLSGTHTREIFVFDCRIEGSWLYFAGREGAGALDRIGIFDIEKEAVIWDAVLPVAPGATLRAAPYGSGQHIFANDSNNILYIYERT